MSRMEKKKQLKKSKKVKKSTRIKRFIFLMVFLLIVGGGIGTLIGFLLSKLS
jgi:flagellar basal body-associated protein FliL